MRERVEHARPARVGDPGRDIRGLQSVLAEERGDLRREVPLDHIGDPRREHDLETGAAHVPADHIGGVGVEARAGVDDTDARLLPVVAHEHDGRSPVAEEPGRDEVGDRLVVALEGERAQLDAQQHADLVRMPRQVVVDAGEPCGSRNTPEPERREPLDVGPETQPGLPLTKPRSSGRA